MATAALVERAVSCTGACTPSPIFLALALAAGHSLPRGLVRRGLGSARLPARLVGTSTGRPFCCRINAQGLTAHSRIRGALARAASQEVIDRIRARREARRRLATPAGPRASSETLHRVIEIIQRECPSYRSRVTAATPLSKLQGESDSLDTLEAMMELEEQFKVELEDEEMEKVRTVQELADLIYRTPRGHAVRTVDDETYMAMIRKSHAENRWGELDDLENNIPPQYIHQGPSLAEEEGRF